MEFLFFTTERTFSIQLAEFGKRLQIVGVEEENAIIYHEKIR